MANIGATFKHGETISDSAKINEKSAQHVLRSNVLTCAQIVVDIRGKILFFIGLAPLTLAALFRASTIYI